MDAPARGPVGTVRPHRPGTPAAHPRRWPAASTVLLLVLCAVLCLPSPVRAEDLHDRSLDQPVSLSLSGWGWCLSYKDVANVTIDLDGTLLTRSGDEEVTDLYLTGTLQFNLPDRTDNFALDLRGSKVRSLFFLKQVSGGEQPLVAEFDGTWLDETNYVAGEGMLAVPRPDFVAIPYFLVVRTTDTDVPERAPGGGWVEDWEFIIQRGTKAFDGVADELARGGEAIKEQLGGFLTRVAVIVREVREFGVPYFL